MSVIGIFSDVHGNSDALDATLAHFASLDVARSYCLGDIVGYGGDPQGCCDRVREHATAIVTGNHDAAVAGTMEYEYYYSSARDALDAHRELLDDETLRWLASLPYTHRLPESDALLCHGSPARPELFEYIFELQHMRDHAPDIEEPSGITFIGHSHLTRSFRYRYDADDLLVEDVSDPIIDLEDDWHYVVTVGSVGQPRDRDARARSVLFDTEARRVRFLYVDYDIAAAARRILRNRRLSAAFAKRLFLGV